MLSWLFSDPLPPGAAAPDFSAEDDEGRTVSLRQLRGRNVVLVFYPGDDTPTCTRQLCEFRDTWEEAKAKNVAVLGLNPWSRARHQKFRRKFSLPFPLLMDPGQKVAGLYRANGLFIKRTVYLIGPDGVIRYAKRGKPSPAEVLAAAV
jgi:thioredoxin-dependent peroxiredoxin